MSFTQVKVHTGLGATIEEFRRIAFSVGIVHPLLHFLVIEIGQAVTHITFTLHRCTSDASVDKDVGAAQVYGVTCPKLCLVHEDIIVIAEAVALLDGLIGAVHIVLSLVAAITEVLKNVGIDVMV